MLATLSSIKSRLGITDTTDDTLLTNLIKFASGRFDRDCNRLFARQVTATDEFPANACELRPARYPVESVSAFHLKSDETTGWVEHTNVDYLIRKACVVSLFVPLGSAMEVVRVTYTGGYVLPGTSPGSGQTALPDEIEQGCIEQAAFWYQRRHQLGLTSVPAEGRSFYAIAQINLLPQVSSVLAKYSRYVL